MKRILIVFLTIFMFFSCHSLLVIEADTYGSESSYSVKIGDQVLPFSDYPTGSYFTDNGKACSPHPGKSCSNCKSTYGGINLHASQCFGFARMVFYRLFGIIGHDTENAGKFVDVAKNVSGSSITQSYLKELFMGDAVKPGAHIRTNSHSLIYMGCDEVYFYTYEANVYTHESDESDTCRVAVKKRTWSEATDYFKSTKIAYVRMPLPQNYPGFEENSYDGYLYKSLDEDTSNALFPGKWMRSTDSTSGELVGSIPYGEYAVVTKYNSAGTWGYVNYKGTVGWTQLSEKIFPFQGYYTCPVVTFNANGGSVSTPSKKVYINTPYGELPTPTRTGYKFSGWYTSASGGTKVTDTSNVTLTEDQTLYAHWTANTYTITYNANGGSGAPANQNKTHDIALTLSTTKPTKTGYKFVNWKATNGTTYAAGASYTANAGTTLTAQWKANTYTITYNANGGSGAPASQTKTHDVALTLSTTKPTRTGYTFSGWATSATGSVAYTSGASYTSNGNQTLYAIWKANSYTVTLDAGDGTVSPSLLTVKYGNTYGTLPTPTRTGFTFKGWYTSEAHGSGTEVTADTKVTATSNHTIYAQWFTNSYTLSWKEEAGATINVNRTASPNRVAATGILSNGDTVYYGDVLSITYTAKPGYTIATKGATNITVTRNITSNDIYATAALKTYTITYNANGGSGAPANQIKTHDVALTLSTAKPTRTGYTFKGWATSASGSVAYTSGANYTSNSSVTLYAVWEKNLVDAQSIVLGEHKTTLEIGETDTVSFSITPANSDWETMYFLYYDSDIVDLKWVNNQDAFEVTAKSAGETEIVIELENESGTKIKTSYVINVKLPENSSVMGDVNGDGEVTSLDVIILSRHIAGWTGYETLPYCK